MKIFNNTKFQKNIKLQLLAIGNFDGVHKGHQKVFKRLKNLQKK